MTYDEVKKFYSVADKISHILFDNDCAFQITSSSFILYRDNNQVIVTPKIDGSTLTLTSISTNHIDSELLSTIDADLWFNLSIGYELPFEYERIEKLKSIDNNFHILMSVQNES